MQPLTDRFRLYTVDEVAELFHPPEGAGKPKRKKVVEQLIKQHGCYRVFGEMILMTEADVSALLRNISVRGRVSDTPRTEQHGHMVFIGSHTDHTANVFVDWCTPGTVDALARRVAEGQPGAAVLDFTAATYGEYQSWVDEVSNERALGKWFNRTREFNAAMLRLFPEGANDDDECQY